MKNYTMTIYYDQSISSYEAFSNVASLMLSFDKLNNAIAKSISGEIETEIIIEDITSGSIKITLIDMLKKIPDEKIKAYIKEPREAISDLLVKTKHKIIRVLGDSPNLINDKAPTIVEESIKATGLDKFGYKVHKIELLEAIGEVSDSARLFKKKPFLEIENDKLYIKDDYTFKPEEIEEIEKSEHIINDKFIIKKPDIIGESKWTLIYDKAIEAKILDEDFFKKIKSREISISHGDRLDAVLKIETFLDRDTFDVVETKYYITKVNGVVPPKKQMGDNRLM